MFKGRTGKVAGSGLRLRRLWLMSGRTAGRLHYSRAAGRYYRKSR